jgi:hypothetical protein
MKIAVDEDRIVVTGPGGGAVRFSEIAEVAAEKVDKVTYAEVFLIVRAQSGNVITIGELDEGFGEAEALLRTHLAGFRSDWWTVAEQAPVGLRAQVWPTQA